MSAADLDDLDAAAAEIAALIARGDVAAMERCFEANRDRQVRGTDALRIMEATRDARADAAYDAEEHAFAVALMLDPRADPECRVCRGTGTVHETHEPGYVETSTCNCIKEEGD